MARAAETLRSQFRGMREALASLVLPAPCRICARMLDTGSSIPFCYVCMEALAQPLREPLCASCGRPIVSTAVAEGISAPQCHFCRARPYKFDLARSFGTYTPPNVSRNSAAEVWKSNALGSVVRPTIGRPRERPSGRFLRGRSHSGTSRSRPITGTGIQPGRANRQAPCTPAGYPLSILSVSPDTAQAEPASPHAQGALGNRTWRLCYASISSS